MKRVLADGVAQGATRFLGLGDIASLNALDQLNALGAQNVFGNWEASGLRGMPMPYRGQVARWPAQLRVDSFWAAHASPVWPAGLGISGVVDYLRAQQTHWTALFPSLQRSDSARWAALAELEAAGASIFFHGHTHIQEAWRWTPGDASHRFEGSDFTVAEGERWLVGVGSVGDPHDGGGMCYTLYDDSARRVTWRRV